MLVFLVALFLGRRWLRDRGRRRLLGPDFFRGLLDHSLDFEGSLSLLLDKVAAVIPAGGYHLYLRRGDRGFVLRASKAPPPDLRVGPDYAGLFAQSRSGYSPPLDMDLGDLAGGLDLSGRLVLARRAGYPFAVLPLGRESPGGAIHIGPLSGAVPPAVTAFFDSITPQLGELLSAWSERDRLRRQVAELASTAETSNSLARQAMGGDESLGLYLALGAHAIGARAGFFLVAARDGQAASVSAYGLEGEQLARLRTDGDLHGRFLAASAGGPVVLYPDSLPGGDLPSYLATQASARLVVYPLLDAPLTDGGPPAGAVLVYLLPGPFKRQRLLMPVLELVGRRVGARALEADLRRRMKRSYLETLRDLVGLLDSQEPFTVTHSAAMARLAGEIAAELGLGKEEVDRISLAAYLHDIGMLGLGDAILRKKGRLSDSELERMRLHTLMGASMVHPLGDSDQLEQFIRHHHERYDGFGYPDGLKGAAIPLGARIIAAADTFNAKVSSRGYRPALPFEDALNAVEAAAGSQLDPLVVAALVRVFQGKQSAPGCRGRALEPCWVMKQCPPAVARDCPAYDRGENCWDLPRVNCELHGDSCRTCLVYTEYVFRTGGGLRAAGGV